MNKKALIFGVTGQDGTYLAELLLAKGYKVYGVVRRASTPNTGRIAHLLKNPDFSESFTLVDGDLTDGLSIARVLQDTTPHEIYNLAAQTDVYKSFFMPEFTSNTNALGALRILETLRVLGRAKEVRYYQASTSELFGNSTQESQNEDTPFRPCSPYGIAKLHAYWTTVNYRNAFHMHASNGILFNHESPIRGEHFVSRKITRAVAAIHHGRAKKLVIGNLNAKRDWGHAKDFVQGIWLMMQQEKADDYVLATGESHTVRECVEIAFSVVGKTVRWEGKSADEKGYDKATGNLLVEVDPMLFRPTEVENLRGDSTKARKRLGWEPSIRLSELIEEMVNADLTHFAKHP